MSTALALSPGAAATALGDDELGEDLDLKVGRIRVHEGQLRAIKAFRARVPIILLLAGIRGGKTHIGALMTLLYALEHRCKRSEVHLVCSPTYPMSEVPEQKLQELLEDEALFPRSPLIRFNASKRTFLLAANGGGVARIKIISLSDPNKTRGIKALSAWLDEAAFLSAAAWKMVQGRLADSVGPCWITTTPDGLNWVYGLVEKAAAQRAAGVAPKDRSVAVIHFASTANVFVPKEGFARLVDGYDSKTLDQEVKALFVRRRGLVYHAFSRRRNVVAGKVDRTLPLWVGQDFNVDPMASVLGQPFISSDGSSGVHILAERKAADSDTFGLVRFLDEFCKDNRVPKAKVTLYPDASGTQRSTSGKSDFAVLRDAKYEVDAPRHNPLVKDRVNCVNGLLKPMRSPHARLLIDPSCTSLIESLEKQIWKPKSDPPAPDKTLGYDHLNDALGYLCWRRWPLATQTRLGTLRSPHGND